MTFTMADVLRVKRAARAAGAARPIAEKLRTLERLRDRDRAIKRAVSPAQERSIGTEAGHLIMADDLDAPLSNDVGGPM